MAAQVDLSQQKIGFIGAGNMAQSIIKGWLAQGVLKKGQLFISAPSRRNLSKFEEMGIPVTNSNIEVAQRSTVVFLACKPYHMAGVMTELTKSTRELPAGSLVVPISVGTPVQIFDVGLGWPSQPVIRVMPSLPNEVAAGIAPYTCGSTADQSHKALIEALFKPLGFCEEVQEHLLDITAQLGGAACAWHAMIIEALSDGAVKMGLPRHLANQLAPMSMMGAAKLIVETKIHPAQVKDNVTSPGGTTIRGVHILEEKGVRGAMMSAIEGAVSHAREMAKK